MGVPVQNPEYEEPNLLKCVEYGIENQKIYKNEFDLAVFVICHPLLGQWF